MTLAKVRATAEDRLWLLRAVQAEGEPRQQVAVALVNLYALSSARGGPFPSLSALVRAYAQPVNPRWFDGGDLLAAAMQRAPEHERAKMLAQGKKRRLVHATRTTFDASTHDAVNSALRGEHATDVTDYAAPSIDATKKGYEPRSAAEAGKNRLWTRSPGWAGYVVAGAASNAVMLVLLATGVWLLVRSA